MRKFFLGLMFSSALAATVIGGALAWTGNTSGPATATAGKVAVSFYDYQQTANKVVPSNQWINVANGGLKNTGDIAVHVTGGTVAYTGSNNCNVQGQVRVTNGNFFNPGEQYSGLYGVDLVMRPNSLDSCQGYTLPYTVTINVAS